jgi:TonB family protein
MSKYSIIILSVLCLFQTGCSLAPGEAKRAYNAYEAKEYNDSIRLVARVLERYEYSSEDKANLLMLKANSYAKLGEFANAEGIFRYVINNFPNTEGAYKAEAQLSSEKEEIAGIQQIAASDFKSKALPSRKVQWPITIVEHKYPKKAAKYQIEGSVKLVFDISEKGTVINVRIIGSSYSVIFADAAIEALLQWRYPPIIENNKTTVSKDHIVVLGFEINYGRLKSTVDILS